MEETMEKVILPKTREFVVVWYRAAFGNVTRTLPANPTIATLVDVFREACLKLSGNKDGLATKASVSLKNALEAIDGALAEISRAAIAKDIVDEMVKEIVKTQGNEDESRDMNTDGLVEESIEETKSNGDESRDEERKQMEKERSKKSEANKSIKLL